MGFYKRYMFTDTLYDTSSVICQIDEALIALDNFNYINEEEILKIAENMKCIS